MVSERTAQTESRFMCFVMEDVRMAKNSNFYLIPVIEFPYFLRTHEGAKIVPHRIRYLVGHKFFVRDGMSDADDALVLELFHLLFEVFKKEIIYFFIPHLPLEIFFIRQYPLHVELLLDLFCGKTFVLEGIVIPARLAHKNPVSQINGISRQAFSRQSSR